MRPNLRLGVAIAPLILLNCSGQVTPSSAPDSGAGGSSVSPIQVRGPANVVFVLTDDLSWDLVPYMPAVHELQAEGITFTRYFVTDSLCCPSRSSIFTGKYPHDTHVFTNVPPNGGYSIFERYQNQNQTFAVTLHPAGYQTGMMGKYLNGYEPASNEADPGWSAWDVAGFGYFEFGYDINESGSLQYYGHDPGDYLTDVLSRKATAFLENVGKTPFFLEVATFAPHAPYTPAPRDLGTFHVEAPRSPAFDTFNTNPPAWLAEWPALTPDEIESIDTSFNLRVESVQAVDDLIRSLRATLRKRGLDKNTYFVFSSDNGYHMGQHMLNPGKQTAFDSDIRVPLVVVGPGVQAGGIDGHIVENIDLCPTFADLASQPPPAGADGRSLVPLLDGRDVGAWRSAALVEHRGAAPIASSAVDPDEEVANGPIPPSYEALRMKDSVFVRYVDGAVEYYDRTRDPFERDNTASSLPPAEAAEYGARIDRIENCHSAEDCWQAQQ